MIAKTMMRSVGGRVASCHFYFRFVIVLEEDWTFLRTISMYSNKVI